MVAAAAARRHEPDDAVLRRTLLTAITDNAALTYLGSLVEGVSDEFKYSLVAGAVTGGGLTVIANAPNPAGFAILKGQLRGRHDQRGRTCCCRARFQPSSQLPRSSCFRDPEGGRL